MQRMLSGICIIFIFLIAACVRPTQTCNLSSYRNRSKCISCHEEVFEAYVNSHHDLAMEIATEQSVLGDFDNKVEIHFGDTALFYRQGDKYFIRTIGTGGEYTNYEIVYTFGWTPLQQYLVEFPRGYYQVLPWCWDNRTKEAGGQHWFHIYQNERISHTDNLFWTGNYQNWNHVCAECHSTGLSKGYDIKSLSFNTTWKEVDVSCDACHGPSAKHLKWALRDEKNRSVSRFPNTGYEFSFTNDSAVWIFDMQQGTAYRNKKLQNHEEIELCARCHSRRIQIWDCYKHGESLMQTHIPEVIEPHLYYADGQIKEEVYVYGSFLQSKMYKNGVTCTNCHDPHSMQVKAPGNILCAQCHVYAKYNSYEHHLHRIDSSGNSCSDCHMPLTNYMVVDSRRDHSIRIPRPDISLKTGSPNSCTDCHTDQSDQWANEWFRKWYGNKYDTIPHYGEVFYKASKIMPEALNELIEIAGDYNINDIVRASALNYLGNYSSNKGVYFLKQALHDSSALARMASIRSLSQVYENKAIREILDMLNDPVRAVRYEAARAYSKVPYIEKADLVRNSHRSTMQEYLKMLLVNSDQPATHVNMGIYYFNEDNADSALLCYKNALRIDSFCVEASINLADLYRHFGDETLGEKILVQQLSRSPESAELFHAIAMLYVRQNRRKRALDMMQKSIEYDSGNPYYYYIYAIALHSEDRIPEAIEIAIKGYEHNPYYYNIVFLLSALYRENGNKKMFDYYYEQMITIQNALN